MRNSHACGACPGVLLSRGDARGSLIREPEHAQFPPSAESPSPARELSRSSSVVAGPIVLPPGAIFLMDIFLFSLFYNAAAPFLTLEFQAHMPYFRAPRPPPDPPPPPVTRQNPAL